MTAPHDTFSFFVVATIATYFTNFPPLDWSMIDDSGDAFPAYEGGDGTAPNDAIDGDYDEIAAEALLDRERQNEEAHIARLFVAFDRIDPESPQRIIAADNLLMELYFADHITAEELIDNHSRPYEIMKQYFPEMLEEEEERERNMGLEDEVTNAHIERLEELLDALPEGAPNRIAARDNFLLEQYFAEIITAEELLEKHSRPEAIKAMYSLSADD